MVFGKNYDRTLWLIMQTDKKNNEELVEFLNFLSPSFLFLIQENVLKFEKYCKEKSKFRAKEPKRFEGVIEDWTIKYKFKIQLSGKLDISVEMLLDSKYKEIYAMSLIPSTSYRKSDHFGSQYIGEFNYGPKLGYGDKENGVEPVEGIYYLINTPAGYLINYKCDRSIIKNHVGLTNMKKIPDDIHVESFPKKRTKKK